MLDTGPLFISEFMAINDNVLADEDGEFSDWIEIYNGGNSTVSLQDWYLTDDALNLTKWRFPAVPLGPGDFQLVFASDKDRPGTGPSPANVTRPSSAPPEASSTPAIAASRPSCDDRSATTSSSR